MKKVRFVFLLAAAVTTSLLASLKYIRCNIVEDYSMFRLTDYSAMTEPKLLSRNTIICDLATFSNIVNELVSDGYVIVDETTSEDEIDIQVSNGTQEFRMLYESTGNFVSLGNPYEKSYVPITYINER